MLTLEAATFGYGRLEVVRDVTLHLAKGQIMAVLGTNGAGKSTFVKTLLGLQTPLSGTILWTAGRPHPIAYLSQLTDFDRQFPMSVRRLVATGTWGQAGKKQTLQNRVQKALEQVEMGDYADLPVHELSGGQLQRARFARTIIQDANLIILDEPFAAVDQRREASLLTLIQTWAAEGRAVILVLHNLSAALQICQTALLLGSGGGDFGPVSDILTAERLMARGYLNRTQVNLMHEAAHA